MHQSFSLRKGLLLSCLVLLLSLQQPQPAVAASPFDPVGHSVQSFWTTVVTDVGSWINHLTKQPKHQAAPHTQPKQQTTPVAKRIEQVFDRLSIFTDLTVSGVAHLLGGVDTNNHDINAGSGSIYAANIPASILSDIRSGAGITIDNLGDTPLVSNSGVLTVQGQSGNLALTAGTGISISGLTITNSSPTQWQSSAIRSPIPAAMSGLGRSIRQPYSMLRAV